MTATEKVLFDQTLANFQTNYPEVKVEHPYDDEYMMFTINGSAIGSFTTSGYSLLYCLVELTKIYEFELR